LTPITWTNETRKLSQLLPWDHNPRQLTEKQAEHLQASLRKFGLAQPFLISPDNEIYDGHQRQALMDIMVEWGQDADIDCRMSSRLLTDDERRELVIRLHENTGEWNWDMVPNLYDVEELAEFGMPEWKIEEFLPEEEPPPENAEPQINRAEELREQWSVELGQMWRLPSRTEGREHRLICGDCTDDKEKYTAGIVDPEWDTGYPTIEGFDDAIVFFDGNHWGDVIGEYGPPRWVFAWNCVTTWYVTGKPLLRAKYAAWYGNSEYIQDGYRFGDTPKSGLRTNTKGTYFYHAHPDGVMLSDIYDNPITQEHKDSHHNHSKPLDWITALIANCTRGVVSDRYCGAGTSIIACEKLSRESVCYEISPGYVAVTLQRYQDAFNITPELIQ